MNWGDSVAATYRKVGVAKSVTFTPRTGSAVTYPDCQTEDRHVSAQGEGGSWERYVVTRIYIPRTAANVAKGRPARGWVATVDGEVVTVASVGREAGLWVAESGP